MRKIAIAAIVGLALGPACVLPFVTADKFNELHNKYNKVVEVNNENVALCEELYTALETCAGLLDSCLNIIDPAGGGIKGLDL